MSALSIAMLAAGHTAASAQAPAPAPATNGAAAAAPATSAPAQPPASAKPAKARVRLTVSRRRLNVRAGNRARVTGRLSQRIAGRTVTLERQGARGWKTIDRAKTTKSGRFTVSYRAKGVDTARVRVRFAGDRTARPARRTLGRLNVFRPALASWYGPGLYGNHLGCGGTLTPGTIGVAHKTLPCGTDLVLRNGSRIVHAKVIDRGPYVGAREFDLTAATKYRLGFGSTGTVLVAH
ncbi:MAG TPA: septal ring lytic transglycosylase RlpA family protein [Solirubrobacteraceae bacterium]|nr:septal ring lytic transglycosylase RlpA family protein [Solirubrobacteraceae bacterium]